MCSICGQPPEWLGKPLTLILDHINGDNHDDRFENLRWVCPNCNQQLDTTGYTKFHSKKAKSKIIDVVQNKETYLNNVSEKNTNII